MTIFYKNLWICAAYVLLGCISLVVNPPDVYSVIIWPSSGLALAAVISWGRLILPSIWIGSSLIHASFIVPIAYDNYLDVIIACLSVGLGSVLQAFIAYCVYLRLAGTHEPPSSDRKIIGLLCIGAASCLISSSWGALVLYSRLGLTDFQILQLWLGWLTGDIIGVLLATPFFLFVIFNRLSYPTGQRVSLGLALILFMVVVNVGLNVAKTESQQKNIALVNQLGQSIRFEIQQRLYAMQQALDSLRAFQLASNGLTKHEFEVIGDSINRYEPSITTLGWAPKILNNDRESFSETGSREVLPGFTILDYSLDQNYTHAGERNLYLPVYYAYPFNTPAAVGLDLLTSPTFTGALVDDFTHSRLLATSVYKKPRNGEPGIMFITPVIIDEPLGTTISINSDSFYGVMFLVFEPQLLIGQVAEKFNIGRGLYLSVTDISDKSPETIFTAGDGDEIEYRAEINVFNRVWKLSIGLEKFSQGMVSYTEQNAAYFFSCILCFFASVLSMFTINKQRSIESLVRSRTEQLSLATKQAEAANVAKSQFLANVSHELRTPLNSIIGFTRRVLKIDEDKLSSKSSSALRTVEKNGVHLLGIINDLLDIAKIESGKIEIHKEVISVEEVFNVIKNDFSFDAQQREVDLEIRQPSSELLVLADRQRLLQVLFNLVSNGLKYTEHGSVVVSAQPGALNGRDGVWFSIEDTGIGISEEDMTTLFDKFVQASSRKVGTPGTGLGLAITRELVHLLGGQLEVSSQLGKGSIFRFWIPDLANRGLN